MELQALSAQPLLGYLRGPRYERVTRGVHLLRDQRSLLAELRAWTEVLPYGSAFSHLTAARVYGWWLPAAIAHPVFAAVREADWRPRRPGLLVCRHTQPVHQRRIAGLSVTTPGETLLAAARDLGLLDLVIMGDSALRQGHCTLRELQVTAAQRRRGAPLLRAVLPLLDGRSESPWESVLRVLHREAAIDVEPQYEIVDDEGRFLARADLWLRGTRRVHEYDGADHRTADAHRKDLSRDRRLVAHGWERMGYTADEVLNQGGSIIASADAALGRSWDAQRLLAWNDLIRRSLFGRAGRARANQRWRRAFPT